MLKAFKCTCIAFQLESVVALGGQDSVIWWLAVRCSPPLFSMHLWSQTFNQDVSIARTI